MQMFCLFSPVAKVMHRFHAFEARIETKRGNDMASSEKRKPKSTRDQIRDPAASLTEEQLLKHQQASEQAANTYLTGTSFGKSQHPSETADSGMSPLAIFPDAPEGDNVFAFYSSEGDSSESPRPTLADAVIEHLRQARLRRQRPH
jgi:hypothetical protein